MRNVLILCTGNSARSILAESILTTLGTGRFCAFSAGSDPKGKVHPMALQVLAEQGFPATGFTSKSWDVFTGPGAPVFDLIITVCDNAAGETCPVWLGHPLTVHWGIDDPAAVEGAGQHDAFRTAFAQLKSRIDQLLALPIDALDATALKAALNAIGRSEGATQKAGQ